MSVHLHARLYVPPFAKNVKQNGGCVKFIFNFRGDGDNSEPLQLGM
jgi:hypothetical protein